MAAHAKYAPSGMYPTVKCHGRRVMINGIEEEDTEASREGTACHWVAEMMLKNETVVSNDVAHNGVIVTDEMVEAASLYVDFVSKAGAEIHVERAVSMTQIHDECWGTPDVFWYDFLNNTVHIADFKYGHGSVIAYRNYQLMAYAIGVKNYIGLSDDPDMKVALHVVQPRCYDGNGLVRSWTTSYSELQHYVVQMHKACAASDRGDAKVTSGDHCTYCPGRHVCSAAQESASKAFEYVKSPIPIVLDSNALGYELEILGRATQAIKDRKEALEVEAMSRMRLGQPVPGFDVMQGYSREKWLKPVEEVLALGMLMGVDLSKNDVITPTQAKTLLKKSAIDGSVIKSYHGKQPTSMKLVRDDGSRAKLIFNQE